MKGVRCVRLHYRGKFDGNEESLPTRLPQANAVQFIEPDNAKTFSRWVTVISSIVFILFSLPYLIRSIEVTGDQRYSFFLGGVLSMLMIFPHELLHAICFKEDVYLYSYFKQGMAFVVGTESMSKWRFILMSLLPNLVFGFVPYFIWNVYMPHNFVLGSFAIFSIAVGAGDYLNIFSALTQMPSKAKTYMSGFHSYWYLP